MVQKWPVEAAFLLLAKFSQNLDYYYYYYYLFFERFSIQKCQNFSENHHFLIFGFQYVGKNIKG